MKTSLHTNEWQTIEIGRKREEEQTLISQNGKEVNNIIRISSGPQFCLSLHFQRSYAIISCRIRYAAFTENEKEEKT